MSGRTLNDFVGSRSSVGSASERSCDGVTTTPPLCVDLDGTLIRSDLLVESALVLIRCNPLYLFVIPIWILMGRAKLKREIARRVDIDVAQLPYDARVVDLVRRSAGRRRVVLCTGADKYLAEKVGAYVGAFSEVLASDGKHNLAGCNKADALVERYGEQGFDYVGNASSDLRVWRRARGAIVVNAPAGLVARAGEACEVLGVLPREAAGWRVRLKALRLHQWLKNLLVFLPLLAAHLVFDVRAIGSAVAAFLLFGICASGVYVLNDLLDLAADRAHPRKRTRPFASGMLPLAAGLVAAPVLTLVAFAGAVVLSRAFVLVLLSYYVTTLAYSFWLKRVVMLDVIVLAALYTIRIVAGTVVIGVDFSFWLLAFSMFLFLSLAMLKRYVELRVARGNGAASAQGRGYTVDDLTLVQSLGTASGYLCVLVLALYINSAAGKVLYHRPELLWLLCPLLLYWISRAWMVAHRDVMNDDPVVFALTDRVSRILLVLAAAIIIGAT